MPSASERLIELRSHDCTIDGQSDGLEAIEMLRQRPAVWLQSV
jgi:hypothetical protein